MYIGYTKIPHSDCCSPEAKLSLHRLIMHLIAHSLLQLCTLVVLIKCEERRCQGLCSSDARVVWAQHTSDSAKNRSESVTCVLLADKLSTFATCSNAYLRLRILRTCSKPSFLYRAPHAPNLQSRLHQHLAHYAYGVIDAIRFVLYPCTSAMQFAICVKGTIGTSHLREGSFFAASLSDGANHALTCTPALTRIALTCCTCSEHHSCAEQAASDSVTHKSNTLGHDH